MNEPFERARSLFVDGVQDFEAGRYAAAESKFQASLVLLPGRVSTLNNLGATLIKLGRPDEALRTLQQVLAVEPGNQDAWSHRGVALGDLGRFDEAVACFDRVLAADPGRATAWFFRAIALYELKRYADTLAAFDRLLALEPDHAEGWLRRGQTLQSLGRQDDALASYDRALAIEPDLAQAWTSRGSILRDQGRNEEAAAAFEQALAHGGDADLNGYFLAAVKGEATPVAAPRHIVQDLFDAYAESFDRHLVGELQYQTPGVLVANLKELGERRFRHALDLGCGTGLCGPLLKPFVEDLDGLDLSSQMLDRARQLGVYERLVQADVVEYLRATDQRHDLVLAADVFVYIGDLEPVFEGVRRVLEPGGVFCFSAEVPAGETDFELKSSMRYGHAERYLRRLAREHGFAILRMVGHVLRVEGGQPVDGLYVYLGRT